MLFREVQCILGCKCPASEDSMIARQILSPFLTAIIVAFLTIGAVGQSLVSGDVTGIVSDPSGSVIPRATVTLKNTATGFQNAERNVTVAVGQSTSMDMKLEVGSSSQTVEVTAESGVIQTDNGN